MNPALLTIGGLFALGLAWVYTVWLEERDRTLRCAECMSADLLLLSHDGVPTASRCLNCGHRETRAA